MIRLLTSDYRVLNNPMLDFLRDIKLEVPLECDEEFTCITTKDELIAFGFKYKIDERAWSKIHPKVESEEPETIGKIHIFRSNKPDERNCYCFRDSDKSTLIRKQDVKSHPREDICKICYKQAFPAKRKADMELLREILPQRWADQYVNIADPKPIAHPDAKTQEKRKMKMHIINPTTDKTYCQNEQMDSPYIQLEEIKRFLATHSVDEFCKQCKKRSFRVTHADWIAKPTSGREENIISTIEKNMVDVLEQVSR